MTIRLQTLMAEAESALSEDEQDELADLIQDFLSEDAGADAFTSDEVAYLNRIAAEPFVEADPARLAAVFARRGTR